MTSGPIFIKFKEQFELSRPVRVQSRKPKQFCISQTKGNCYRD